MFLNICFRYSYLPNDEQGRCCCMENITLRRSDRLEVENLLATLRTLKESESWSEKELEKLAVQKFRVLQRYNPGSRRLIEEC
uniref:Transposase n=1 Tax=Strongyloides venezuelensis TaxID=75913 RepID=A0A0K0FHZ2_STRVS